MAEYVTGLFPDRAAAEAGVQALLSYPFARNAIEMEEDRSGGGARVTVQSDRDTVEGAANLLLGAGASDIRRGNGPWSDATLEATAGKTTPDTLTSPGDAGSAY